jgi:hypothetical protein
VASAEKVVFGSVLSSAGAEELATETTEISMNSFSSLSKSRAWAGSHIESLLLGGGQLSPEDEEAASLWFITDWAGAVADATVGMIAFQLASIPVLTVAGCQQLKVDVSYLRFADFFMYSVLLHLTNSCFVVSNVFNAVGLKLHPLLDHICTITDPKRELSGISLAVEGLSGE